MNEHAAGSVYPLRIEGELDEPLSRWRWLVKWILAIPHFIALLFLWIAFFVLTVVTFFATLFTGRYPSFTLAAVEDHPARVEVAYSQSLSRGLVLGKWWLLALPHYLVGVDKNSTIMFPAPLMSTIGELGAFLGRENRAATPSPIPTPVARAAHGNGDPTAGS